jgi:hypothetical protein
MQVRLLDRHGRTGEVIAQMQAPEDLASDRPDRTEEVGLVAGVDGESERT